MNDDDEEEMLKMKKKNEEVDEEEEDIEEAEASACSTPAKGFFMKERHLTPEQFTGKKFRGTA